MSALEEIGAAVQAVNERVRPGVVGIGSRIRGSGVVIATGQVVTNAHNLRGDEVTVTFFDGRRETGRVVGADLDGDLAVIAVGTGDITPLDVAADTAVAIGSPVVALSATRGGPPRVSVGFVSATERAFRGPGGRRIAGSVEHTAPMAPGSSGGPVVDLAGRLLGINTNRLGEGFYLAVPADAGLRDRIAALGRGEAPSRPRLGIAVAPPMVARRLRRSVGLSEREGVLVRGVEEGSLADRAGIAQGDLIVAAAGRPVADVDDLHETLAVSSLPIELTIVRGEEERTVSVGGESAATGEA
jgi:serine protease Do